MTVYYTLLIFVVYGKYQDYTMIELLERIGYDYVEFSDSPLLRALSYEECRSILGE